MLRVLFHAETHRRYISRLAIIYRQMSGMRFSAFARSIIPQTMYLAAVTGAFAVAAPSILIEPESSGDSWWGLAGPLAATVVPFVGAVLLLVNLRTGRPLRWSCRRAATSPTVR